MARFLIERVMEVDPETAVKFKDGQRAIRGVDLGSGAEKERREEKRGYGKQKMTSVQRTHKESPDSIAKFIAAQIFSEAG